MVLSIRIFAREFLREKRANSFRKCAHFKFRFEYINIFRSIFIE